MIGYPTCSVQYLVYDFIAIYRPTDWSTDRPTFLYTHLLDYWKLLQFYVKKMVKANHLYLNRNSTHSNIEFSYVWPFLSNSVLPTTDTYQMNQILQAYKFTGFLPHFKFWTFRIWFSVLSWLFFILIYLPRWCFCHQIPEMHLCLWILDSLNGIEKKKSWICGARIPATFEY